MARITTTTKADIVVKLFSETHNSIIKDLRGLDVKWWLRDSTQFSGLCELNLKYHCIIFFLFKEIGIKILGNKKIYNIPSLRNVN